MLAKCHTATLEKTESATDIILMQDETGGKEWIAATLFHSVLFIIKLDPTENTAMNLVKKTIHPMARQVEKQTPDSWRLTDTQTL